MRTSDAERIPLDDFKYSNQNLQLRAVLAYAPNDLRESPKIVGVAAHYSAIQSHIPLVFVKDESLKFRKEIQIGESYYQHNYLTKEYKGRRRRRHVNPPRLPLGEYAVSHGTPELVWNDPYSVRSDASLSARKFLFGGLNKIPSTHEAKVLERRELSFGWILRLVGSDSILAFARWDDKEGFNRLLGLMDDEEALHVQQVLMNPEYFEHKERFGFVEETKDTLESTHEKKKRVHPLINWAKRSLDDDYGITPIVLGLSIVAISVVAVLLLVSSLNDPRHAKLDGKVIANRVHLMLASTVKFGSTDGTIFLDTQTKIPTLAIALGKGGVQPTAGAVRIPVSKSTHLEGATYPDGEWCIAVSYGMGTAVYTNSGYQKKLSSCSR